MCVRCVCGGEEEEGIRELMGRIGEMDGVRGRIGCDIRNGRGKERWRKERSRKERWRKESIMQE